MINHWMEMMETLCFFSMLIFHETMDHRLRQKVVPRVPKLLWFWTFKLCEKDLDGRGWYGYFKDIFNVHMKFLWTVKACESPGSRL